ITDRLQSKTDGMNFTAQSYASFLSILGELALGQIHGYMRRALDHAAEATTAGKTTSIGRQTMARTVICEDPAHIELVDVQAKILFRVSNSRTDHLIDRIGGAVGHVAQDVQRLPRTFAAYRIHNQTHFLRRHRDMPCNCFNFKSLVSHRLTSPSRLALGLRLAHMTTEGTRGRKLAQLVADHVFCDVDGNVAPAIVYGDRVPDHLREDCAGTRPGPNDLPAVCRVQFFNFF